MNIIRLIIPICLVLFLNSCNEIARELGYVAADSISEEPIETDEQRAQREKEKIKENIAKYVKIIWHYDSFCIENNTDYTLEMVSVMTSWTEFDGVERLGYQEPRQFTYIPAHSTSTTIEYNRARMHDMKGQIYEIKCSALGL